jgi:cobalt/nickel transport system ATP-binding protein
MDIVSITPEEAVRIEDLDYAYPDGHRALTSVSLQVNKGESVAIMGPNGAGKSTLALHLNGILTGRGRIEIMGLEVNKKNMREIRGKVGLVFQDPDDQLFSPTVRDDVAFGPLNQGLTPDEVDHAVSRALAWVGMEAFEDRSPHHMSFGEKKRVSVATVLSMDPEILVLDEPVSNMDPRGRREFIELIKTLEATKFVVTHDVAMAQEICGRIVLMDKGEIVADGRPESVFEDRVLLEKHGLI